MIEVYKANREEEPLVVSKSTVKRILQQNGVSGENIGFFNERYDAEFGLETMINLRSIPDTRQIELTTSNVAVKVNGVPICIG